MSQGERIIKDRNLGFLIWQSITSTAVFLLSKTLLLSLFTTAPLTPAISAIAAFFAFHLSLLLFSTSLSLLSSPQTHHPPPASPLSLAVSFSKLLFPSAGTPISPDFRRRARVSLSFVLFAVASALSGYLSIVALCWNCDAFGGKGLRSNRLVFGPVGFKGFAVGLCYGLHYLFERRWVLEFPLVQRPPWFSFKKCLPSAIRHALKLSLSGYLVSAVLAVAFLYEYNGPVVTGSVIEQILFYVATLVVFLCWELCHHLHQVLHTKRVTFAPPKGSAAAETNPSEPLLAALEASIPRSLLQYLAYLDLCMVSECNVDTWRRAAFFEETGETYKRVMFVCLRPLEQLTSRLGDGLDSCSIENSFQVSHQLRSPSDRPAMLYELFYDFQLCAWCARIAASLTVHSHKEDRFGVAQLSGSNAAVVSTLLSSLLAVETFMGKKNNLQSSMQYATGPANIKWAALSTERRDATVGVMGKRKGNPQYSKAYATADILRTSIYHIVSHFHNEMLNGSKAGLLEKDWIISNKPLYGSCELLLQKLHQFLDFQAC